MKILDTPPRVVDGVTYVRFEPRGHTNTYSEQWNGGRVGGGVGFSLRSDTWKVLGAKINHPGYATFEEAASAAQARAHNNYLIHKKSVDEYEAALDAHLRQIAADITKEAGFT